MTGILSQYMMRTILASTALVLVVLLALAGLFEFIAELDDTQGDYGTAQAILYTLLRLPNLAFEMFPIAALIGSLLGLGALASNSEIIVMRSAGLSVAEMSGMVALSGAVLLVFTALLGEFIGPPLDFYARNMRVEARYQQDDERQGNETWVKDGDVYLHLERVNPDFEFGSLYMYKFDGDRLASIAVAENSGIDSNDNWILENLRETQFRSDGVQVTQTSRSVESFEVDSGLLGSALAKPLSLSARELLTYIDYLQRNNLVSNLDGIDYANPVIGVRVRLTAQRRRRRPFDDRRGYWSGLLSCERDARELRAGIQPESAHSDLGAIGHAGCDYCFRFIANTLSVFFGVIHDTRLADAVVPGQLVLVPK